MSAGVRIIIKDVKKRTNACDECKRRKGKCDGSTPCEWCASRKLECTYSGLSQKRGPKRTREGETVDMREQGMAAESELTSYVQLYLKHMDPLFTMYVDTNRVSHLATPRSYSQFGAKYAACAMAARAFGSKDRANQLIKEARYFVAQSFDDFTVDNLFGCMMLASFWLGTDHFLARYYVNCALNIFASMNPASIPGNARVILNLTTPFFTIGMPDRFQIYLAHTRDLIVQSRSQAILASFINVGVSMFVNMGALHATPTRADVMAALFCQSLFTQKQRMSLITEIRACRKAIEDWSEIFDAQEAINFHLSVIEVVVEWRSGHPQDALPLAIETAKKCSLEIVQFGNRYEVEFLLAIAIFLREQRCNELADKIRDIAQILFTYVCTNYPFSSSIDALTSYFERKTRQDPPSSPPPSDLPPPSTPSPPSRETTRFTNSANDATTKTKHEKLSHILSLTQSLYAKHPTTIFTSQGMYTLYSTLSSLLPPSPGSHSPLDEWPQLSKLIATSPPHPLSPPPSSPSPSSSPKPLSTLSPSLENSTTTNNTNSTNNTNNNNLLEENENNSDFLFSPLTDSRDDDDVNYSSLHTICSPPNLSPSLPSDIPTNPISTTISNSSISNSISTTISNASISNTSISNTTISNPSISTISNPISNISSLSPVHISPNAPTLLTNFLPPENHLINNNNNNGMNFIANPLANPPPGNITILSHPLPYPTSLPSSLPSSLPLHNLLPHPILNNLMYTTFSSPPNYLLQHPSYPTNISPSNISSNVFYTISTEMPNATNQNTNTSNSNNISNNSNFIMSNTSNTVFDLQSNEDELSWIESTMART